eukprot:COSAG04_NODE_718_length_10851_cov_8.135231_10_plen_331_part_00
MDAAAAAPPQPAAAAPPLPFLGDDIFVLIAAELDARMLGRLACAAQRFSRPSVPDPAHRAEDAGVAELWSVAEEGARRRLCAQSEQVRGWVSRGGVGGSWLRALGEAEKLQRPLRFTAHHQQVWLGEEGTVATKDDSGFRSAVCGGHEMRHGRHYATFTLRSVEFGSMLGVVGPGFDVGYATDVETAAYHFPHSWMLGTFTGNLHHANRRSRWEGQPEEDELKEGDVVVRLFLPPAPTARLTRCRWRAGPAARPRGGDPDGVGQRRAEGRRGPPRHDRQRRPAGGSAGGAAALGGRRVQRLGGDQRALAATRLAATLRLCFAQIIHRVQL